MASRRLYELARERGLTTAELIERLERDGIHGKQGLSTIDEDLVDAALADTADFAEVKQQPSEPAPAEHSHNGQGSDLGPIELRRRLWQLRRRQEAQLKELGGLAVELRRLGSNRYEELAAERLEAAAETERELLELERQMAPENVGGVCPNCGLASKRTRYCLRCGEELPGRHTFNPLSPIAAVLVILAIASSWLLGGITFGGSGAKSQTAYPPGAGTKDLGAGKQGPVKPKYESIVATVNTPRIHVYRKPVEGSHPKMTLNNPNLDGAKLVFLVIKRKGKWLKVWLPERPNGSKGWIAREHVTLAGHSYRMVINLDRHFLKVWKGKKKIFKTTIGVGQAVTPTPTGEYYITELLEQPDPTGTYGPYAFGLSAHSDVLNEFAGRDGVLGVHGTNFPQGIGTDVSHGCIRMSNKAVTKLASFLPVGTPVRITRDSVTSA
jgi:lipoprotein-anchoring transpeptidase ErfK/SrfK